MTCLATELTKRGIKFDKVERRVRYLNLLLFYSNFILMRCRCFPHVVNRTCKSVLGAITKLDFAANSAPEYVPTIGPQPRSFLDAIDRDPIATVRTLVRVTRSSSLRCQYFSEILKTLEKKDLQLLRDVDIRWSSTLLMVERAILLHEAIDKFLESEEFEELHKYQLTEVEWDALEAFHRILSVPHAFQQKLSAEKTPTLCNVIPSYEAMAKVWEAQQHKYPETSHIIQAGLDKLEGYRDRTDLVPAYVLAMSKLIESAHFTQT
ncbi:ribonuclease H-like domain-containing protein [Amylocystis lapponica]|nr:ribonuclease H-like domain-containing protein [Amylocystis lapponica]